MSLARILAGVCLAAGLAYLGLPAVLGGDDDGQAARAAEPRGATPAAGAGSSDVLTVKDFACFDHTGTFQRLSRNSDAQLVVLYVYANECPIVRQYARELEALRAEFAP